MNRWLNDKTDEGWLALCICILANVTTEQAFRLMENPTTRRQNRRWTQEDFEEIEILRSEGFKWKDIAEMYNMSLRGVSEMYNRVKRRSK